jgi:dihydroceramidase
VLSPQSFGLWGTPTSTIDWCEANYSVTPVVCEFFNTVSSLAMVIAGALGVFLHRRVFDVRTRWAFGLLALVGVGSIAFHGTLRFEFQILDELPMLYLVSLMAYLILEPGPTARFGVALPIALVCYAMFATAADAFTRGRFQFFAFQIVFGGLEMFCLFRVYLLSRQPGNEAVRSLFRAGVVFYVVGILLWFIDLRFCSFVSVGLAKFGIPNPQLHAWWHVLVSCGFYLLLLVVGYDRLRRRGASPSLSYRGRLPSVKIAA